MSRPAVISCAVLGGRNPKTGIPVGERHRWSGGAWGQGHCIYCRRHLEDVLVKPERELTLDQALARGDAEAAADAWRPTYWGGQLGIDRGWYVQRQGAGGGVDWLLGADGELVRRETEAEALGAAAAASSSAGQCARPG